MRSQIVDITPKQAKAWLSANNKQNRNLRYKLVEKYASDMRAGNWHQNHQGIAFYADGSLADGQHRLAAIAFSGCTVSMLVVFDVPKDSGKSIDMHAQRQVHDAIRLGGAAAWINKEVVSVVRQLAGGIANNVQLSADQIEQYAMKFENEIQFVMGAMPYRVRNVTTAPIRACVVCAAIAGEDREKLRRFCEIMGTGEIASPEENAAIRLREYLLSTPSAFFGSNRLDTAKRAQHAIKTFCQRRPLSRLYTPTDYSYPVPAISTVIPEMKRLSVEAASKFHIGIIREA